MCNSRVQTWIGVARVELQHQVWELSEGKFDPQVTIVYSIIIHAFINLTQKKWLYATVLFKTASDDTDCLTLTVNKHSEEGAVGMFCSVKPEGSQKGYVSDVTNCQQKYTNSGSYHALYFWLISWKERLCTIDDSSRYYINIWEFIPLASWDLFCNGLL